MNKIRLTAISFIFVILQNSIFSGISIFNSGINIFIPYIISLALLYGANTSGYTGLVLGLLEDLTFGNILGIRAISYFIIGYLSGKYFF